MHDLVDGLLSAAEIEAAQAHVAKCADCREEYARLSEVVATLRSLPRSAEAPAGLWTGIEDRMGEADPGQVAPSEAPVAKVVPLPGAHRTEGRLSFSVPQLAAAAVVISLLSAGTVWMALSGGANLQVPDSVAGPQQESAAQAVSVDVQKYDAPIAELEEILDRGRALLSRETLLTLETSLRTIDEAIEEVRIALERDPASELLTRMLVNHKRTKLRVLRQAATSVHFRS
jgi:anti-sigma factor RsiW